MRVRWHYYSFFKPVGDLKYTPLLFCERRAPHAKHAGFSTAPCHGAWARRPHAGAPQSKPVGAGLREPPKSAWWARAAAGPGPGGGGAWGTQLRSCAAHPAARCWGDRAPPMCPGTASPEGYWGRRRTRAPLSVRAGRVGLGHGAHDAARARAHAGGRRALLHLGETRGHQGHARLLDARACGGGGGGRGRGAGIRYAHAADAPRIPRGGRALLGSRAREPLACARADACARRRW